MAEGLKIVFITIGVCIGILIAFCFINRAFRSTYGHSLLPGALLLTVVNAVYIFMGMKEVEIENPLLHFLPLILIWALVIVLDLVFFKAMGIVAVIVQAVVSIATVFTLVVVIGLAIIGSRSDVVEYRYYYY